MFREQDHPRDPAGKSTGGQFKSSTPSIDDPEYDDYVNALPSYASAIPKLHTTDKTPIGEFRLFTHSYKIPKILAPDEFAANHETHIYFKNTKIQSFEGENPEEAIEQAMEAYQEHVDNAHQFGKVYETSQREDGHSYEVTDDGTGSLAIAFKDELGTVYESHKGLGQDEVDDMVNEFANDPSQYPEPEDIPEPEPEDDEEPEEDEPAEVEEDEEEDSGPYWWETDEDPVDEPADDSDRVYQQFKAETERYLRNYTIVDVDRYGVGGNIMKMILSLAAMHAMPSMMGSGTSSPRRPAAQKQAPSNQDFEKLHPRAQTQSGNSKPGQFAKKPEGASQSPVPRQARPLTERPDMGGKPVQRPVPQPPQQQPVQAKPWLAEPGTPTPENTEYNRDPRRGTPEQKAAQLQQRMARDQAAQPPVQQPKDANTARIAEIWDVDTTQPELPRNYPDNLNKPPEQQTNYAPPAHSLEGFTQQVMKNLKTPPNEQDNPRKRFLLDGTPNPGYAPQDLGWSKKSAPSLLDMPAQSGSGDIFANPAAKARKEKAELDRITKFDPADFAEPEQPEAPGRTLNVSDTDGDYVALEEARKQRAKQVSTFRDWEKQTQENPETNTMEVAAEYELDPEQFSNHIREMQAFEESEWKRREAVKTAIRKTWGVDSSDLKHLENRKGGDSSNLSGSDELKGNLSDDQVYEFLGSDESMWTQNAYDMIREETPPRPGAHDKDWIRKHAEHFAGMSSQLAPQEDYPEPEDGMPFSRRALVKQVDRYFRDARQSFRARKNQKEAGFWTLLDAYL
jgi:hypothetical protein